MKKKLEITLFGTFYSVGVLRLNRNIFRAGMKVYGPGNWNKIINDIALKGNSGKLLKEVSHTIGKKIKVVCRMGGIAMCGNGFGMEVFHKGRFASLEMVEADNKVLQPPDLMKGFKPDEMLGIFWGRREGVMLFRWNGVEDLNPQDVVLSYDSLGPLTGSRKPFDLAVDITWQGQKGRRAEENPKTEFDSREYVFHMAK